MVNSERKHEKCLKSILKKFGKIDILINGAGINSSTPFFDLSVEEWDQVSDSQIKGTFLGCNIWKEMVEQGHGSIINISSASADPPIKSLYLFSS